MTLSSMSWCVGSFEACLRTSFALSSDLIYQVARLYYWTSAVNIASATDYSS